MTTAHEAGSSSDGSNDDLEMSKSGMYQSSTFSNNNNRTIVGDSSNVLPYLVLKFENLESLTLPSPEKRPVTKTVSLQDSQCSAESGNRSDYFSTGKLQPRLSIAKVRTSTSLPRGRKPEVPKRNVQTVMAVTSPGSFDTKSSFRMGLGRRKA